MKTQIIDASVALKWFLNETNVAPALKILEDLRDNPSRYVVPELFYNETLAVFARSERDLGRIKEWISILGELGLSRIGNGQELLSLAAELALRHGLSGYDAIYAATAVLVEGEWITADERAHQKIKKLGISRLLESA